MRGGPRKNRKRKVTTDTRSSPFTEESNVSPGSGFVVNQSSPCSLPSTPQKGQSQEISLTSTPIHSSSIDNLSNISDTPTGAKQAKLENNERFSRIKTSKVDSPAFESKSENKCKAGRGRKRTRKEPATQTCSKTNNPQTKRPRGRPRKDASSQSSQRSRPRFELNMPETAEQDESLLSSDLSIELSHHEEQLPPLPLQEDDESDEDEEEELPSFLMQMDKKPPSITEGAFVWYKFRHYPFWPALVKSVNRKLKKASIVFIDDPKIHTKKGFFVSMKNLKPFDCLEAKDLVCKAKEKYDAAIEWSLDLIADYRIRIACGSFSGSFIEYFAHDMSYPVRRKYPQATSERLTISSDMMEESGEDHKEDSVNEQQGEVSRSSKRLLPDRTHAAHNRANEKLVHFIVKQRMVEERLLAVIRGQEQSRWLRSFLSANRRRVVNTYLEDDQQLDRVYCYLNELCKTAVATAPCLAEVTSMERVPFVLDVLLPEAIIYAIAGVDNVSVKKAEEKYLKGRCISNRERQEFDLMIERQIRKKSQLQNAALTLMPDPVS